MRYDHDHDKCVFKVCPCCGWDPLLNMGKGGIRQDTRMSLPEHHYSCSLCSVCEAAMSEANMRPEDREEHIIEEAVELSW